jgi:serine/threonine protein kinase
MGGGESKESSESQAGVLAEYRMVSVTKEQGLGEVMIYSSKADESLLYVKEITVEAVTNWDQLRDYIRHKKYKAPEFITEEVVVVQNKSQGSGGMLMCGECSSKEKVLVLFKDIARDLEGEITCRTGEDEFNTDFFPESEIWYILERILKVESHMMEENRFHGDIRTTNIYITEDGNIKFTDTNLFDPNCNAFSKTLFSMHRCNIPPESLKAIQLKNLKKEFLEETDEKTEVWAIGLLLLSVADLKPEGHFYNWPGLEVKERELKDSLQRVKQCYSELLVKLITQATQIDRDKRISIEDVLGFLTARKAAS